MGISKCLPAYCNAEKPNASVYDIPVKDFVEVHCLKYLGEANFWAMAAMLVDQRIVWIATLSFLGKLDHVFSFANWKLVWSNRG